MSGEVCFRKRFDKRDSTIFIRKGELEEMGLPTEHNGIRDASVYLYVTVYDEDGKQIYMRRKRLLPKRSTYCRRMGRASNRTTGLSACVSSGLYSRTGLASDRFAALALIS